MRRSTTPTDTAHHHLPRSVSFPARPVTSLARERGVFADVIATRIPSGRFNMDLSPLTEIDIAPRQKWWQRAVFYEIALLSFQDSDGDGKGDLAGLLSRIDYLEWLGVDAIWLTPIYRSPMLD